MLPGFKHRLMCELLDIVSTAKYKAELGNLTFKFHSPPAKENYVAWLGGELNNFCPTNLPASICLTHS
jgi:actin-related protein 10